MRVLAVTLSLLAFATACSRADRGDSSAPAASTGGTPATEVRLAYFPNVTHASALIGLDKGYFTQELGSGTKLTPTKFNAGPDEVSALLGGSVDIGFIGSGPAINAFSKSGGDAVRLVSGATSGGAQLVVKPEINTPQDLQGKVVADPQAGNTQDVALKKWIADQKLTGVNVQSEDNSVTLDQFRKGAVQAAWLPQPWSARLVAEAGAKVLVDEKTLWPDGRFPTTVVVVRTQFLNEHPQTVQAVLKAVLDANNFAASDPTEAKAAVNRQLKSLTGSALSQPVLDGAFANIELTTDPLASRFPQLAQDQVTAGIAKSAPEVKGFFDLAPLNAVLTAAGKPAVSADGLDQK
ncbi:NitT/TauT family transport system substrate-binding protein [Amycolatopsis bartoniae]|uniref:Sulfonate ABC transporter substrate-binding protein n=1 Tax=Amycolatopsis bartoniae TaxID=941986 RepID=A0A8H9IUC4_9PSEU|nr:ABC transporter substrate-binding protein [Amycolatopsis bartoniae]MBB2935753.1 NitT/TauT family transport system substrate-binding protein [Amycolatopsis bartoniae]GHF61645.1 sulfonate ABC transporter substrate-binding protein [Amycolatopsis bartoniae]